MMWETKAKKKVNKFPYYLQPTGRSLEQREGSSYRNKAASMLTLC